MPKSKDTHDGGCLCGGVRFQITGNLPPAIICHCDMCQRASGSAFGVNIIIATNTFAITVGEELLTDYESSPGRHRQFCKRCGTPLCKTKDNLPDHIIVRVGALDCRNNIVIGRHIHHGEQAAYAQLVIPPTVEVFPGHPA